MRERLRETSKHVVWPGVPLIEGTTGWNDELEDIKKLVAVKEGSLVFGANFSIGVNLFYRVTDFASELIAKFEDYEVFIEEQHHSRKVDAPSGTALKLKSIVGEHFAKDFSVASTRAGNIPGTHLVGFDGTADQINLEHIARSREGFASGAVFCCRVGSREEGNLGVYRSNGRSDRREIGRCINRKSKYAVFQAARKRVLR